MRYEFAHAVLQSLIQDGAISRDDRILVVCAGPADATLMNDCELKSVVLTSLDPPPVGRQQDQAHSLYPWEIQDAEALSMDSRSFDLAFVSEGLHHCSSPHRALLEMYRVARKGVLAIEPRDSLTQKVAVALGLSAEYELDAVLAGDPARGGVNNTDIPNYIYRWTEREFQKVIRSFDPTGQPVFRFYYGLNLSHASERLQAKSFVRSIVARCALAGLRGLSKAAPSQRNTIAMLAMRPRQLHPWLVTEGQRTVLRPNLDLVIRSPEEATKQAR